MLCPVCGSDGKLEQVEFNPNYEKFFCHTCKVDYIAYDAGSGNLTELVPASRNDEKKV